MAHRSSSFDTAHFATTAEDIAGTGTCQWTLKKHSQILSYAPDQIFSRHQITVSNLDGGTFEVSIMQPGHPGFVNHQGPGLTEDDTCMIESPVAMMIQVDVSGHGGTGVPTLHLTSMPRMS